MGVYSQYGGSSSILAQMQRMKEEADRKAREEEERKRQEEEAKRLSLSAWRRDLPQATLNPQPQPIGPITKEQAIQRGYQPPTNVGDLLTRPTVDTGAPPISASQPIASTVAPVAPVQPQPIVQPEEDKPRRPSAMATVDYPYSPGYTKPVQPQWNPSLQVPPTNAAASTPLLVPFIGQQILNGYSQIEPYLQQAGQIAGGLLQANNYGAMQSPPHGQAASPYPQVAGGQPGLVDTTTPFGALIELTGERLGQRAEERKAFTPQQPQLGILSQLPISPLGTLTWGQAADTLALLNQGFNKTIGSKQTGVSGTQILASGLDLFQMLDELASIAPLGPSSDPSVGTQTLGMAYAKIRQASDYANNLITPTTAEVTPGSIYEQSRRVNTQAPIDWWAVANPRVWQSFGNFAEYLDMANKDITAAITPTPEQVAANTPERIAQAKAMAVLMAHHGIATMGQVFDNYLDYPTQAASQMEKANQIAIMADQSGDEDTRRIMWAKAGKMAAEAVKLRETTPLDLYNQNQNAWYSLPFEALAGFSNAGDWASRIAPISPAARRMQQGSEIAGMAENAIPGINRTLGSYIKDSPIIKWLQTNRSKAMVDAFTNFSVLGNLISGFEAKGDIAKVITRYIDGTLQNGIDVAELTSPSAYLQAVDGVVPVGWAAMKDYRAIDAKKALDPIKDWLMSMPSLAGPADEIANKVDVMGDLLGALTRSGAQQYGVSTMEGVPWGATTFNVVPQANGTAFVQYLDSLGNNIGQSATMSLTGANSVAKKMETALKKGSEFKANWAQVIGDFERNVLSTFTLNSNPGQWLNNALGGYGAGLMDLGPSLEFLHPQVQQIEYLTKKLGGFFPSARTAEGVGGIMPQGLATAQGAMPTGATGKLGWALNASTLGLSWLGKKIRTGTSALGEEGIATTLYYTAFKTFMDREFPARITPIVQDILANAGINSPETANYIVRQVIDAGLAGGRIDIAKTFQDIASGKIAPSISSISPVFADLFNHEQTLEMNGLLRNLSPENLPQVQQRINEIINVARSNVEKELGKFPFAEGTPYFTRMEDEKDVADVVDQIQFAAQMTNRSPDLAIDIGKKVYSKQQEINQAMMEVFQQARDNPILSEYMLDLFTKLRTMKDVVRTNIARSAEAIGAWGPAPADLSQTWERHFADMQHWWEDYGDRAISELYFARDEILSGRAAEKVRTGEFQKIDGLPDGYDPMDLLHAMSNVDIQSAKDFLGAKLGFQSKDPIADLAIQQFKKLTDYYQMQMYNALGQFPTQQGFDAAMTAFSSVRAKRNSVLAYLDPFYKAVNTDEMKAWYQAVKANLATPEQKKAVREAYDRLALAKNKWQEYYKYAWDRYEAARKQIGMYSLPTEALEGLKFEIPGSAGQWTLRGPSYKYPNQWAILSPDGRTSVGTQKVLHIPQGIIDEYNRLQKAVETSVAEGIGREALKAVVDNPLPEVDAVLQTIGDKASQDLYVQVRRRVQELAASFNNYQMDLTVDPLKWRQEKLNVAQRTFNDILANVAQMNAQGYGKLDFGVISEFNKRVLPLFDNIIAGAQRYGDEMTSISILDYTRQYHPDVLLGMFAPYHFFFTRMGKNALERQLFNPKVSNHIQRFIRNQEAANRADNQPNRNIQSGWGPTIGDTTYGVPLTYLARWIPVLPLMAMHGWVDPDRANRGYEYALEAAKEQGWPATAKGFAGNIMQLANLMQQGGFSFYPWVDAANGFASGEEFDLRGSLGQLSSLHRMLGYGAARFAGYLKDTGQLPVLQQGLEGYAYLTQPPYVPYLYGREASFEANRGDLTDTQARFVQDLANQSVTGNAPMPEQAFLAPNAQAQYQAVQNSVNTEYFIKALISWLTGATISTSTGAEQNLREGKELMQNSGYSEENPAGSQAARYSFTDPESANYVPGEAPYSSQYSVMGESSPGVKANTERPGFDAARTAYYDELDELKKRFMKEEATAYAAHPEWNNREGLDAKSAFDKDLKARREEALAALQAKYPSVTSVTAGPKSPYSLYGARPNEVIREAQDRLLQQAYDIVGDKPPDGSPPAAYDEYNAKLEQVLTQLMNNPQAASDVVYGQDMGIPNQLPSTVTIPGRASLDVARSNQQALSGQPATSVTAGTPPTLQNVQPDPDNQWFDLMTQLEQQYNLPPGILQEIAKHESSFNPDIVNSDSGATGLFQFMPNTWAGLPAELQVGGPTDPEAATKAAAYYLDWLNKNLPADKQNDPAWLAAAYNAGIGAVSQLTSLDDIHTLDYSDAAAREAYAKSIGQAVSQATTQTNAQVQAGQPFSQYPIIQEYGDNPNAYKRFGLPGHDGIDFDMPVGTPLPSVAAGTVTAVGYDENGWGHYVGVDVGKGTTVFYAHLSETSVQQGQAVSAGDILGLSGGEGPESGNSSGAHLHLTVRQGGTTQKYNVDPSPYLAQWGTPAQTPTVQPRTQTASVAPTTTATVPATTTATPTVAGGIPWPSTAQEVIAANRSKNKSPERVEAEASIDAEFEAIKQRAIQTYPEYAGLWQEYRTLTDDQKQAWREAHPMMKALNLAGYNPEEWTYLEKTYGKGIVEQWANIPPYTGDDSTERSAYYHKYPTVFLANAWINGRPHPYEDEAFDPEKKYERDFGKDYQTAKEMFGDAIWDTVREYYTIPPYVKGGDNSKWLAFKETHPEFDQWRAWWYALMGDQVQSAGFQPFGRGFSGGFNEFNPKQGEHPQYIENVEAQRSNPPTWGGWGSSGNGDWRKYLQLGEVNLKGWRR